MFVAYLIQSTACYVLLTYCKSATGIKPFEMIKKTQYSSIVGHNVLFPSSVLFVFPPYIEYYSDITYA